MSSLRTHAGAGFTTLGDHLANDRHLGRLAVLPEPGGSAARWEWRGQDHGPATRERINAAQA